MIIILKIGRLENLQCTST